jgi:hypothetical protein
MIAKMTLEENAVRFRELVGGSSDHAGFPR